MAKANEQKQGHSNFLHLNEMLHHMEGSFVAAYELLSGPAMSQKERAERKLAESEAVRRAGPLGF